MPVTTIRWEGDLFTGSAWIIDQTLLPTDYQQVQIDSVEKMWEAIKVLRVRGAPAIGIAAAMGVLLGVRTAANAAEVRTKLEQVTAYLGSARPTAVNLFWALERMQHKVQDMPAADRDQLLQALFDEALSILEEDRQICRQLGQIGSALLQDGMCVLTHCNAGALATADYGTALAVIYAACEQGKKIRVYADETRPLLQGARLTTWELHAAGIPVTLICDNMAAVVMQQGKVDVVLVGADRIAANGDVANKIGTYGLAVLAAAHHIPFYSVAPCSTFDLSLANGSQITIEERSPDEIKNWGGIAIAPAPVPAYAPAFDVTPAKYLTGIVTERGILRPPLATSIRQHIAGSANP